MIVGKPKVFVIAAIILFLAAYNFPDVFPKYEFLGSVRKPYYYVSAAALVCAAFALYFSMKKHSISCIFLAFTINNLADEFIFSPTDVQYNEYFFAAAAVLYAIYYPTKNKQNEKDVAP